ncbi:MAG: hypothetical protein CMJ58_01640 [Planctomycetaceae bacterium]|nr:hypothetical protein [Planctomycetaceae bacterium]
MSGTNGCQSRTYGARFAIVAVAGVGNAKLAVVAAVAAFRGDRLVVAVVAAAMVRLGNGCGRAVTAGLLHVQAFAKYRHDAIRQGGDDSEATRYGES